MATTYPGFQSYVSSAPSPTSPYGRFVSGKASDDGDLDNSAFLMALAMANTDSLQWCGWRINYLNPVEGSAGNPALTAAIVNYNNWDFKGPVVFEGVTTQFSAGIVLFQTTAKVVQGSTLRVGDSTLGVGHVTADGTGSGTGSSVTAQAGAFITATGSGTIMRVVSGAQFQIDTNSSAAVAGPFVRTGVNAILGGRAEKSAPLVTASLDITQGDTFAIGNTAADVVCTLEEPSVPQDVTFYAQVHNNNYFIVITGASTSVAKFLSGASLYVSVTFRWTGTRWIVLGVGGDSSSIDMLYGAAAVP